MVVLRGSGRVSARRRKMFVGGLSKEQARAGVRPGGGFGAWRHAVAETLDVGPSGGLVEGRVDGQLEGLDDFCCL